MYSCICMARPLVKNSQQQPNFTTVQQQGQAINWAGHPDRAYQVMSLLVLHEYALQSTPDGQQAFQAWRRRWIRCSS